MKKQPVRTAARWTTSAASTMVEVTKLVSPDYLIEINAIALVG